MKTEQEIKEVIVEIQRDLLEFSNNVVWLGDWKTHYQVLDGRGERELERLGGELKMLKWVLGND